MASFITSPPRKPGDQNPDNGQPNEAGADASSPNPGPSPMQSSVTGGPPKMASDAVLGGGVGTIPPTSPAGMAPRGQPESSPGAFPAQGEMLKFPPSTMQAGAALAKPRKFVPPSRGGGGGQAPAHSNAPDV